MDFSRLTLGDKIIGGSGIALFVFSLLPWFGLSGYSGGSGWSFFITGIIPTMLGLVMVAWVIGTKLADVDLPELPLPEGLLLLGVGGAAAGLIILRLLFGYKVGPSGFRISLDRQPGLYLATLAALGLVGGAFVKFQEDGGQASSGGGSSTPPTPF